MRPGQGVSEALGLFLSSGHIAEFILALLAVEAVVLFIVARRRGEAGSLLFQKLAPMLLSGMFFALALRAALQNHAWPWLALWLSLAGASHILDLRQRLR